MVASGDVGESGPAQRRRRGRIRPPDNEMPGALALDRVLGRTDQLAVVLVGGLLFSTGVQLQVSVLARNLPDDEEDALLEQAFADPASAASGTALLLGVQYADGRTTTNLRFGRYTFADMADDEDRLCLNSAGGGGNAASAAMGFWLTPQAPLGDLLVVCAWPYRGIPETRTVITAAELDAARSNLSELWPWEPDPEPAQPPAPSPPVLPPGWFTDAWNRQEQS
jgi:hypothetical protein